ncbi:MAG TPA: DoxX family protein [Salinimicrobium catena]|uniref:DoxX family protein n=1 Tax=Salinimicrobium catena TaxID=390640 RepID=A0A7C2RN20_9FLAO|nr:DoxX family protein [Salinimicrobium catena]
MENFSFNIPILLILLFTVITFLQSGLDKITDWKGNVGWLKEHFGKTFLGGMVPLLVATILVLEVVVGLLAIAGIYSILVDGEMNMAYWSLVLAAVTLLMLLFGQRVAKDYPGAFTITGYFMVVIFGLFLIA